MHIEPGPIPTFIASAPASINALAASVVAIFPAIKSILNFFLISATALITLFVCPCAVSTAIISTFAFLSSATLSK